VKTLLKITLLVVFVMSLLQMPSSAHRTDSSGASLIDCNVNPELCVPCNPENLDLGLCDPICVENPALQECIDVSTTVTIPPTTLPVTTLPTTTLPPVTTTLPPICLENPADPLCPPAVVTIAELITQFPALADGEGDIPTGVLNANTIITDNGVGALLPTPDTGVFAEGHDMTGVGQQLFINVLTDGTIHLKDVGDESADNVVPRASARATDSDAHTSSSSSSGDPSCSDDAKTYAGFKVRKPLAWKLRKRSIPISNKTGVMNAIKAGATNVENVTTRCSLDRSGVSLDTVYKGKTLNKANLDASGNCLSPNGKNVVDFSSLPVAGRTCSWYTLQDGMDTLIEADIRFSKTQKWTLKPSGGCARALDLAGTATHEFGHAFGLAHVSSAHKTLTMTEYLPLCSTGPRTLGKGDINGLRKLY
jgi:hypothetical protein